MWRSLGPKDRESGPGLATRAGLRDGVVCLTSDAALEPLQQRPTKRYEERFGQETTLYVVEQNMEVVRLD